MLAGAGLALPFLLSKLQEFKKVPLPFWIFLFYMAVQGAILAKPLEVATYVLSLLATVILAVSYLALGGDLFRRPKIRTAFLAVTFLQIAFSLLQFFELDPIFSLREPVLQPQMKFAGFFGHFTFYGAWMAAMAWYWWVEKHRVTALLCSLACFATLSLFALFSWIAAGFALLAWRGRWLLSSVIFAALSLAGLFLSLQSTGGEEYFNSNGRFKIWNHVLAAILERPWFGYGAGTFAHEFPTYHQGFEGKRFEQAHNELLQVFFEGGLVGLVLALAVLSMLWWTRKNWWQKEEVLPWFLVFVVFAANSLGNFPWHSAPMALFSMTAYLVLTQRKTQIR